MRLAARVDANHAAIVKALRSAGRRVLDLSRVGKGCPDILVGFSGRQVLMEIKSDKGKLNEAQEAFRASWPCPVVVVRSPEEALAATGIGRQTVTVRNCGCQGEKHECWVNDWMPR